MKDAELPRRTLLGGSAGLALSLAGCSSLRTAMNPMDNRLTDARTKRNIADYVVTTTEELEAAFDALSPGDTIQITNENAPYRTTKWLDIDENGVTVVGSDVPDLIKPADGANVGGIRIGHNDRCRNVRVRGVGYHGNPEGQSGSAKWCHGITVRDAENVTLAGNYLTRTHPYHEHGSGGSGISAERECRNVRIDNNRIYDIGDRGIQLAGDNITVSGNIITDGLDRSVSCDLWRDGEVYQARNVSIVGNVMGNNSHGSLTGIGGGNPNQTDRGYVTIANNVGFGRHKSLCHLGFEGDIHNVKVEGNVSVQQGNDGISGISVEIERATNITVTGNDLYGYGGRGINVEKGISDFTVARNGVYDAGGVGIRIADASNGTVEGNYVRNAGRAGIVLNGARFVGVENNRIRGADRVGIVSRGGGDAHNEINHNRVRAYGGEDDSAPGILVRNAGNIVQHNRVHPDAGAAIVEGDGGRNNLYDGNWSTGRNPWHIGSPGSMVRNHTPGFDTHRGLTADDSGVVHVPFDKPYDRRPKLAFGRVGGGVEAVSYTTTGRGNFDGAEVTVGRPGADVDVFVETP